MFASFAHETRASVLTHLYPLPSLYSRAGLQHKTGAELAELYASFTRNYPVISIEDPFDQDDWESYTKLTEALGKVRARGFSSWSIFTGLTSPLPPRPVRGAGCANRG